MQPIIECVHLCSWHSRNAIGEVGMQFSHLLLLHCLIIVVIGLEEGEQRVFLFPNHFIAFVHGEVELSDKRPIHPGLSHIVSQLRLIVAWQKPHNNK